MVLGAAEGCFVLLTGREIHGNVLVSVCMYGYLVTCVFGDNRGGAMKQIPFGTTGVQVSEMCLGAMHFGSNTPDGTSIELLDAYVERGGAFIDTANIYNRDAPGCKGGESERLIGRWMKERGNRSELFLATKVGMHYPGQPEGLRAAQIEEECNKSLSRLGVDVIDLYYAHADDRETPLEESLEAFNRLVLAGKVRFIGASNYLPTRFVEARCASRENGWAAYTCIQQRYSYLRPRPGADFGIQKATDESLLDYCRSHDLPLVGYAPMLKGAVAFRDDIPLRGQYDCEDGRERLATLKEVANDLGASPAQVTLAWMRHQEGTVIPLIGVSRIEQLHENLGALELHLDDEVMRRLA